MREMRVEARVAEAVVAEIGEVGLEVVVDGDAGEDGEDADGVEGLGAALGMDVVVGGVVGRGGVEPV